MILTILNQDFPNLLSKFLVRKFEIVSICHHHADPNGIRHLLRALVKITKNCKTLVLLGLNKHGLFFCEAVSQN